MFTNSLFFGGQVENFIKIRYNDDINHNERRLVMNTEKQRPELKKIIQNIALIAWAVIFWTYVILTIVFWYKGAPERFFEYEITENGSVEITYCSSPFFMLNVPDTIDGKPVTSIGAQLFEDTLIEKNKIVDRKRSLMRNYVTAIHLPDTVEEIHFCAFEDCINLRTINMPKSLKYTGWHILADTNVSKLVFPEGITEIGCGEDIDLTYGECSESFGDMKYLRKVVFPKSLKKIGNNAFANCRSLKKIKIPDGVEEISYGAFQDSGLKQANFPKSLTTYDGCIFRGTPFEETLGKKAKDGFVIYNDVYLYKYVGDDENVVIPDGIENICDRAFWTGKKIKTVEIPKSVKHIDSAFQYSSVESLDIPDTVDTKSGMSFYGCSGLKKLVLPDKMTKIESCAFEDCISLESIHLPKKAKSIGYSAFSGCRSLKSITIPDRSIHKMHCAGRGRIPQKAEKDR